MIIEFELCLKWNETIFKSHFSHSQMLTCENRLSDLKPKILSMSHTNSVRSMQPVNRQPIILHWQLSCVHSLTTWGYLSPHPYGNAAAHSVVFWSMLRRFIIHHPPCHQIENSLGTRPSTKSNPYPASAFSMLVQFSLFWARGDHYTCKWSHYKCSKEEIHFNGDLC